MEERSRKSLSSQSRTEHRLLGELSPSGRNPGRRIEKRCWLQSTPRTQHSKCGPRDGNSTPRQHANRSSRCLPRAVNPGKPAHRATGAETGDKRPRIFIRCGVVSQYQRFRSDIRAAQQALPTQVAWKVSSNVLCPRFRRATSDPANQHDAVPQNEPKRRTHKTAGNNERSRQQRKNDPGHRADLVVDSRCWRIGEEPIAEIRTRRCANDSTNRQIQAYVATMARDPR